MRKLLVNLFTSCIIICLAVVSGFSQSAKQIPMRDFFRNPEKFAFQISPDGKYVSFMQPYEKRQNIFVQPRDSREETRVTSETERSIAEYFWKGNNRILYLRDFGGDENFHLFAVDKDGKNFKDLTPFEKVKVQIIDTLEDND